MTFEHNGILNILKPPGMTSFDVVGYLRGLLKIKKIGHSGTLDPAAAGVLPIFVGQATKAIEFMVEKDKFYRAELTLGVNTDTQDNTGTVLKACEINCSIEQIIDAVNSFKGKYLQIPPMYSALKVEGKKLYEYARQGITVERKPREIDIYDLNIIDIDTGEQTGLPGSVKVIFDVHCSKGTYIRTLCEDIGQKLGCGGHMSFLVRLKAGSFDISSSITLEEIEDYKKTGVIEDKFISVDKAFKDLKNIFISNSDCKIIINGGKIELEKNMFNPGDLVKIYSGNNDFIAIGDVLDGKVPMLKSRKLFVYR